VLATSVRTLPAELRQAGYDVTEMGEGERILATAIVERFVARADGEFEQLTEGSTNPIALTVTHGGIVKVRRYAFSMPLKAVRRFTGVLV
jgi:hypothetical protein